MFFRSFVLCITVTLLSVGTAASVKGLLFQSTYLSAAQAGGLDSPPSGSNSNSAMTARQRASRQKSASSASPPAPAMLSSYAGQKQRLFAKEREDSDDELYSPADLIMEGSTQPSGFVERELERERDSISESSHNSRRNLPSGNQHKLSLFNSNQVSSTNTAMRPRKMRRPCVFAHVPYNHNTAPFSFMRLVPCLTCRRKWVPETILSTIEPPTNILVKGKGQLLEARVCRQRKAGGSGENEAVKISDVLPFVEYDIQRQIILKLKVLGMNAAFGYTCRMQVGSDMVIATAICTAVYLESLPPPQPLQISTRLKSMHAADNRMGPDSIQNIRLMRLQKEIEELTQHYKGLLDTPAQAKLSSDPVKSSSGESGKPRQIGSSARKASESSGADSAKESSKFAAANQTAAENPEEEEGTRARSSTVSSSSTSSSGSSSSSSSSTTGSSSDGSNDQSGLESPAYDGSEEEPEDEIDASEEKLKMRDKSKSRVKVRERSRSKESKDDGDEENNADEGADDDEVGSLVNIKSPRSVRLSHIHQRQLPFSKKVSEPQRKQRRSIFRDDRAPFILELDDETGEDLTTVLEDWIPPVNIDMINLSVHPGSDGLGATADNFGKSLVVVIRGKLSLPQKAHSDHSHGSSMLHSTAARTAAKAMKQTLGRTIHSDRLLNGAESGLTPMLNRYVRRNICIHCSQVVTNSLAVISGSFTKRTCDSVSQPRV